MATSAVAPRSSSRWSSASFAGLRWLVVAVLAIIGIRFFGRAVANYVHFDPVHYRGFWAHPWWLVAHLAGGGTALLLGPTQFSSRLRRKSLRAHRWLGRFYLVGILVGATASVYMALYVAHSRAFGDALLFLAFAWVLTTLVAWISAMRRQITAHREWMVRSYVITYAFVLFRLMDELHFFVSLGDEMAAVMNVWIAWVIPLLLTEVVLQWGRQSTPKRNRPAPSQA